MVLFIHFLISYILIYLVFVFVTEVLGGGGRERPVKQWAKTWAASICNKPLPPHPHARPSRSKFGSAGPGQVEIRECRAESVCNRPLLPSPPTSGPVDLNAGPRHKQTGCIMHWVHTNMHKFMKKHVLNSFGGENYLSKVYIF